MNVINALKLSLQTVCNVNEKKTNFIYKSYTEKQKIYFL